MAVIEMGINDGSGRGLRLRRPSKTCRPARRDGPERDRGPLQEPGTLFTLYQGGYIPADAS